MSLPGDDRALGTHTQPGRGESRQLGIYCPHCSGPWDPRALAVRHLPRCDSRKAMHPATQSPAWPMIVGRVSAVYPDRSSYLAERASTRATSYRGPAPLGALA